MNEDGKPLILIIDDNDDIRSFFRTMLPYKGFRVIDASTSTEAEELLGSNPGVRLIIMDLLLSGENGIDITLRLKKKMPTTHIPVLLMSAHPNARHFLTDGVVNGFIEKPFGLRDILDRIQQLLQTPAVSPS